MSKEIAVKEAVLLGVIGIGIGYLGYTAFKQRGNKKYKLIDGWLTKRWSGEEEKGSLADVSFEGAYLALDDTSNFSNQPSEVMVNEQANKESSAKDYYNIL